MREGDTEEAERWLREALEVAPENVDARVGLGILAWREGDLDAVRQHFQAVQALDPERPEAQEYLSRLPDPVGAVPERPPLELPDTLHVPARAWGDFLEVRGPEGGWEPLYIRGMNLGAALPGRFPAEFPLSQVVYRDWIEEMAEMGVNVIRVYTIHPPVFYQALRDHNLTHPDAPIRVLHGVWAELPPGEDYLDPGWEGEFFAEMRRVVDLIHGRADIPPRPGHASGSYVADVSPWTLGYIIGREWEPHSVETFNALHPGPASFEGRFLTVRDGGAMDAWLARAMETMVAYEADTYRVQRPIAYTTWPTLDPLHHPSEATVEEEEAIREALGDPRLVEIREYDNDGPSVDPSLHRPTPAFQAGVFAAYHAYPYYPDFLILSEAFREARSSFGPSFYMGYLEALKAHHRDIPVVIAEYGLPASLGNSHIQPQGLHHGGLSEQEQAEGNRRLTLEIAEAEMAGGILFAWIDEWFKRNWPVLEFEAPADHIPRWLNRLNSEQHYGVRAKEPIPPVEGEDLEARRSAWAQLPPLYAGPEGAAVRAGIDAAYLWIHVETGAFTPDQIMVGVDLVDPEAGEFRWPGARGPRLPVGIEFVFTATPDSARLLAHPTQNLFRHQAVELPSRPGAEREPLAWSPTEGNRPPGFFQFRGEQLSNAPYRTRATESGDFQPLLFLSNRRRFTRDSTEVLAVGYDRGRLPAGNLPDGFWEWGDGVLEVRLPWNLINVTDPSTRTILESPPVAPGGEPELGYRQVEGVGVVVALRSDEGEWRTFPGEGEAPRQVTWEGWVEPEWRARRRPTFDSMRQAFQEVESWTDRTPEPVQDGEPGIVLGILSGQEAPPGDTVDLPTRAHSAWMEGDADLAEELYRRILQQDPGTRIALIRLGLIRSWQDRLEEAIAYFDRALAMDPDDVEAAAFRARVLAWQGDLDGSLRALDRILERDPAYALALEIQAQVLSWAGEYEAAASAYGQLLSITPGEGHEVRRSRARALISAGRVAEARQDLDRLLEADPADHDARLGLARLLTLAGELEEAVEHFRQVVASAPERADAWAGLARAHTWADRLMHGEEAWRRALELAPGDESIRAGLVQNLRWQGRNHAALEAGRVPDRPPGEEGAELREQIRWARAATGPRAHAAMIHERDSDGHRAWGGILGGAVPLYPGLEVGWHAESRWMTLGPLDARADGVSLSLIQHLEPGWRMEAAGGGSAGLAEGGTRPTFRAELVSPGRAPLGFRAAGRYAVLDGTAALLERDVRVREADLEVRWSATSMWRISARGGLGRVDGTVRNRRWRAGGSLVRGRYLGGSAGLVVQGMGFQESPGEGYFSPSRLILVEAPLRWRGQSGSVTGTVEGAPGLQRIGSGDWDGAVRGALTVGLQFAPGREATVSLAGSSSGVDRISVGDADYRYSALTVGLRWGF